MSNFNLGMVLSYHSLLIQGALITLLLTIGSAAIGAVLGPCVGMLRASKYPWLSWTSAVYVDLFRATPTLVQVVWVYFALPVITGVQLSGFASVLLTLGLHEGAYVGEIFRAGIKSIDKGQMFAARAIGMSYRQAMQRIILPQAFKRMVPPLINEFASLMKLTSLASVIAVPELLHAADNVISFTFRPMETYTTIAAIYAILVLPIIALAGYLDRRSGRISR
jgi:polar amino acid transport system permease protein